MRGIYMRRGVTITITHLYEDMCKERGERKLWLLYEVRDIDFVELDYWIIGNTYGIRGLIGCCSQSNGPTTHHMESMM
jgi:hypothetical protein